MELLLDLLERCEKLDIRGWYRAKEELAALREAGGKMAERLRHLEKLESVLQSSKVLNAESLAEWEAANK